MSGGPKETERELHKHHLSSGSALLDLVAAGLNYLTSCAWAALWPLSSFCRQCHTTQGARYTPRLSPALLRLTAIHPARYCKLAHCFHLRTFPIRLHVAPSNANSIAALLDSRTLRTRLLRRAQLFLWSVQPICALSRPARIYRRRSTTIELAAKRGAAALHITRSITLEKSPLRHQACSIWLWICRGPLSVFLLSSPYLALRRTSLPFAGS